MSSRLLALLALLVVLPASAQDVPLDASALETVDVEIVNVEVYVTDDKSRTVDGLRARDFRLYVDNEPAEIANFYRTEGSLDAAHGVGAGERVDILDRDVAPEPVVVGGAAANTANQSSQPATIVLYVDHLQLTHGGRRSFLRQIRDFLDGRLAPGDQVMVVSHAGKLELEQRFSGDFDQIESVLDGLWQAPAGAMDYEMQWRNVMDQIENILLTTPRRIEGADDPCERVDKMHELAGSYSAWVATQVDRSLDGLEQMVQILAPVEGRKSVLYLSNGLHQNPGADMYLQVSEICPGGSLKSTSNEISGYISDRTFDLTRKANSAGVTLHTLDATGLAGNSSAGASAAGHSVEVNGRTFSLRPTPAVDSLQRDSRQATLHTLAHETGGLAILNANDIGRDLERIDDSLRRFYSLGFRPPSSVRSSVEAESSHLVRVELEPPRKGHTLHYRRTYVAKAPGDVAVGRLMSALLLGLEDNPLGVDIVVGRAEVSDTGLPTVPLRIALPLGSLGWLEHGEQRTGEVELYIAVESGDGDDRKIDMRSKKIPFRIQEDLWAEARGQSHTLEIGLPVPSLDARLAFAVTDLVGQRTSYLSRQRSGDS